MMAPQTQARTKLLDAALQVIRTRGYAATSVDDICAAAGVTKGSFFHHFKTKEDLAVAAAGHFGTMAKGLFETADYQAERDPAQRVLGYIDFRTALLQGELPQITCLLGTMVQETYATHPAIRAACDRTMSDHIADLARDIGEAKKLYAPDADWSAESLAFYTQAVLQGAFVLAKTKNNSQVAVQSLAHLRRYLETLFTARAKTDKKERNR